MYSHYRRDFHTSEVHWSLLLVADDMVRLYSTVQSTNSVQLHYSMLMFNEEFVLFLIRSAMIAAASDFIHPRAEGRYRTLGMHILRKAASIDNNPRLLEFDSSKCQIKRWLLVRESYCWLVFLSFSIRIVLPLLSMKDDCGVSGLTTTYLKGLQASNDL